MDSRFAHSGPYDDRIDIQFAILHQEEKSILIVAPGFEIHLPTVAPNKWWKFWQFVLLGWRWNSIKK